MAIEYIGRGAPDGTVVFQSGEKGGFYGLGTAIVQPSGATLVTTAGAMNTTAMRESLNQVITFLRNLGLSTTISGYSPSV